MGLMWVVIIVLSACSSGGGELKKRLDALALPPEITLIEEKLSGNDQCLDECLNLTRLYSSSKTTTETYRIFTAALERVGYRCSDHCEAHLVSVFKKGSSEPDISLIVFLLPREVQVELRIPR
jgi:hypothetical protein